MSVYGFGAAGGTFGIHFVFIRYTVIGSFCSYINNIILMYIEARKFHAQYIFFNVEQKLMNSVHKFTWNILKLCVSAHA